MTGYLSVILRPFGFANGKFRRRIPDRDSSLRRPSLRMTAFGILLALASMGCATRPGFTTQHPAFAMNPATCATLGPAVAILFSASPFVAFSSSTIGKSLCDAESSVVAGPPAQITQTTTTVNEATKVQ